jgi:hypothetical protein
MSEGKSIIGKILVVIAIVGCLYGAYYFLFRKESSKEPDAPSGATQAAGSSQYKGNAVCEPPPSEVINNLLAIWHRSQGGR